MDKDKDSWAWHGVGWVSCVDAWVGGEVDQWLAGWLAGCTCRWRFGTMDVRTLVNGWMAGWSACCKLKHAARQATHVGGATHACMHVSQHTISGLLLPHLNWLAVDP